MEKNKTELFYLQHKIPWETEWIDIESDENLYSEKFKSILKKEPAHLIEMEYRIIKKNNIRLKSKKKVIHQPVCVLSGTELSDYIRKLQECKKK